MGKVPLPTKHEFIMPKPRLRLISPALQKLIDTVTVALVITLSLTYLTLFGESEKK